MKKIISIMLLIACALTCSFVLASCDEPADPNAGDNSVKYTDVVGKFATAVGATVANTVDATVKVEIGGETLNATYNTVKNSDGTKTMTYSVEEIADVDSADHKKVVTGETTSNAAGVFTNVYASAFGANGIALNLNAFNGKSFDASANVLRINVAAANTEAVLGTAIDAEVVVVVTISANAVSSVTLNYQTATTKVEIVCEYNKAVA